MSDINNLLSANDISIGEITGDIQNQLSEVSSNSLVKDLGSNIENSVTDKVSSVKEDALNAYNNAEKELSSISDSVTNIKDSLLSAGNISSLSDLNNVKEGVANAVNNLSNSVNSLKDIGANLSPQAQEALSSATEKLSGAKDAVSKMSSLFNKKSDEMTKNETTQETDISNEEENEEDKDFDKWLSKITKEEAMAYDPNGLKHFMNIFLETMAKENIVYKTLGLRRWAVTRDDEKVYGNAFLEREATQVFKTLDSDGVLYWLGDFNSRHYYGEAADIIRGDLAGLLEDIALSEKTLKVMHKFGICIQFETSASGHSKGTHFHASTDQENPQTKWWAVVNQIRDKAGKKMFTVILKRDYFEAETKNAVLFA